MVHLTKLWFCPVKLKETMRSQNPNLRFMFIAPRDDIHMHFVYGSVYLYGYVSIHICYAGSRVAKRQLKWKGTYLKIRVAHGLYLPVH